MNRSILSKSDFNKHMIKWVYSKMHDHYISCKGPYEGFEAFLLSRMTMVTFNFDQNKIRKKYFLEEEIMSAGHFEMKQFNHFYNLVCRKALGRKYLKSPSDQKPFSFVCMDVNGSRYWKEMGDIENIHLHSIWLMDNEMKESFNEIKEKALSPDGSFDLKEIDEKRYTGDIKRVISYASKFEAFNMYKGEFSDTFAFYPKM